MVRPLYTKVLKIKWLLLISFFLCNHNLLASPKLNISGVNSSFNIYASNDTTLFVCNDSLTLVFPSQAICAGTEFNLKATFKSGKDVLWFSAPTGGVATDTTHSGNNKTLLLNASQNLYFEVLDTAAVCSSTRTPVSVVVNTNPTKPVLITPAEICKDSLSNLQNYVSSALDTTINQFKFYSDSLRQNEVLAKVGKGSYYVFQKSSKDCFSPWSLLNLTEKDCDTLNVANPLSIIKTADKDSLKRGENVKYTLTVSNSGTKTLTQIQMSDSLRLGLSLLNVIGEADSIQNSGRTIIAHIDSLKAGQSKSVQIVAKADSIGNLLNVAEIKSFQGSSQSPASLKDSVTVKVLLNCNLSPPAITASKKAISLGDSITLTALGCTQVLWSNDKTGVSIIVKPQSNTTYQAFCIDGLCKSTASNSIQVLVSADKPTITASKTQICYGQEVDLTVVGCNGQVNWSNGSHSLTQKVSPDKNTDFWVICTDSTAASSYSDTLTIKVDTVKSIFVAAKSLISNVCPVSKVNLNSAVTDYSAGSAFVFKGGKVPGSSTIDSLVSNSGLYYIFAKDGSGCFSAPAPVTVNIISCDSTGLSSKLKLELITDRNNLYIGDTLSLTTFIKNIGTDSIKNLSVTLPIPSEFEIVKTDTPVSILSPNIIWTKPVLAAGMSDSLKIELFAKTPGSYQFSSALKVDTNKVESNLRSVIVKQSGSCIASSLALDTLKLNDGTYQFEATTYLTNCGNMSLNSVKAQLNLSSFTSKGMEMSLLGKVNLNESSLLNANETYDGSSDIELLTVGGVIEPGRTDTINVRYRVATHGVEDRFYLNTIVSAETLAGVSLKDTSNAGNMAIPGLVSPSVVRFVGSPPLVVLLNVKETSSTVSDIHDVVFEAVFKNNSGKVMTNFMVTDSLSKYFNLADSFYVSNVYASGGFLINSLFDGKSQPNITLSGSSLAAHSTDTLKYVVTLVNPHKDKYFNQLNVSGTNGSVTLKIRSNWSMDFEADGEKPTEVHLPNVIEKQENCVGLGLVATEKIWNQDGTVDITYNAVIGNCGSKKLTRISLCDQLVDESGQSVPFVITKKPKINSNSFLFLNTNYDGINDKCFFKPELSYLEPGAKDTLSFTIKVNKESRKTLSKSLTVSALSDSTLVSDISNNVLNVNPLGQNPTVVSLDSAIFHSNTIGLAKKLEGITVVDSVQHIFDFEFKFLVQNYTGQIITKLQLEDDLAKAFGDSSIVQKISFSQVPAGWTVNPAYTGKGNQTNLLKDSSNSINPYQAEVLRFISRIQFISIKRLEFENFGVVIGSLNNGQRVMDVSTDGENPDFNLSGSPFDDSMVTRIDLRPYLEPEGITALGIAKNGEAELTSSGGTRLTYTVVIKNYGQETLGEVKLKDDLSKVFESNTQFVVLKTPEVNVGSSLIPNKNYDGLSDLNLLSDSSKLEAGIQDTLTFSVGVFNMDGEAQVYKNQIAGTAIYKGIEISDLSVAGFDPDEDGDGDPGNDTSYTVNEINPGVIDTTNISIILPEGLSPNNDGKNDVFTIQAEGGGLRLKDFGKIELEIYNRWGSMVYKSEDYVNDLDAGKGWKGQSNTGVIIGKENSLPDGTYYYLISSSKNWVFKGKKKTGYITLKR